MGLLDRFRKWPSSGNEWTESWEVHLYSPEDDQGVGDTVSTGLHTLPKRTPDTNFMVDEVKEQLYSVLNLSSIHAKLGPVQHLLALSFSPENLKAYIRSNKEAADILLYCYSRFTNQPIPPELHYAGHKINKVIKEYGMELIGKNTGWIRNMIRVHLKKYKVGWPMHDLFQPQNNDMLIEQLANAVKTINEKEEHFISFKKADFLLQELGLFIQNHCSTDSYLFYDKSREEDWSDSTKFALSYLSSDVPLDRLRMNQLSKLIEEMPQSNTWDGVSTFVAHIEEETLGYGLALLQAKTKNLTTPVRETLRDRFTERHIAYWRWLKERVTHLTNQPNITL